MGEPRSLTVRMIEGYIALALHDIEHMRGPQREGVHVFREFFKAMQSRMGPNEFDWGPPAGRENIE